MELIQEIMREWYVLLSRMSVTLSVPVKQFADQIQLPLFTAFLLGLVGSLSPCQLTTNLSAITYVSRKPAAGQVWSEALAYSLGKLLVYMSAGGAVILLGLRLDQATIPVVVAARKAIGPLMIIIGLGIMGLIRFRGSFGSRFAAGLRSRLPRTGTAGAFSLGMVFSFSFCPTLFWLFFGLLIPMAFISTGGWAFPAIFALGTTLPLLAFASLLAMGGDTSVALADRLKKSGRWIPRFAGGIFVLLGINETLVYWFI
ncbi:MAG: sulfite exporter TauE/SafE family protein [Deltaproteobacteria bacterium]|nr:sulfite exporter TauE/SafE family protein [Deltaproteobacteria bacterium]